MDHPTTSGARVTREVTLKPHSPPSALLQSTMRAKQVLPQGDGQITLYEDKIQVRDLTGDSEELPRRYTFTHDERTGQTVLTAIKENNLEALRLAQSSPAQEEVQAELTGGDQPQLTVTCRVDDELTGRATDPATRRREYERGMPYILAVIRYADRFFFERHPDLDQARITVEFRSDQPKLTASREYGRVTDYRVTQIAGESRRLLVGAAAVAAVGIGAFVYGKIRSK